MFMRLNCDKENDNHIVGVYKNIARNVDVLFLVLPNKKCYFTIAKNICMEKY
jgi:hypothetical protein